MTPLSPQDLKKIERAKATLKSYGYFTDNLWHIDDVHSIIDCDEDTAQSILKTALISDAIMEQVWLAIDIAADTELT